MDPIRLEFTYTPQDLTEAARTPPPPEPSARLRAYITWAVIALAMVVVLGLRAYIDRTAPPRPPRPVRPMTARDWMAALLPWVAIFALVGWFLYHRFSANSPRALWQRTPSLQRRKVLAVDAAGVTLTDPHCSTRWEWTAFNGWSETGHLLILHEPGNVMLAIPKRAATSDAQLRALRDMIGQHIVPKAGAFPVVETERT